MKKTGYILGKIGSITTLVGIGLLWLVYLFIVLITVATRNVEESGILELGWEYLPYTLTLTTALGIIGLIGAKKAKNGKKIGYYFMLISGTILSLGTIIQLTPAKIANMGGGINLMMPSVVLIASLFYVDPHITILGAVIGLLSAKKQQIITNNANQDNERIAKEKEEKKAELLKQLAELEA